MTPPTDTQGAGELPTGRVSEERLAEIRARDDEWIVGTDTEFFEALHIHPVPCKELVWPREWAVADRRALLAHIDALDRELLATRSQVDGLRRELAIADNLCRYLQAHDLEVAIDKRDAARYRWLRERDVCFSYGQDIWRTRSELDTTIDSQLAAQSAMSRDGEAASPASHNQD